MDSITSVIIAALVSGVNSAGSEAVKDAYCALKSWLLKNLPQNSGAADALKELEKSPEAELPQTRLNTELVELTVTDNTEALALLRALVEKMNESDNGKAALSKLNIQAEKIGAVGEKITIQSQSF